MRRRAEQAETALRAAETYLATARTAARNLLRAIANDEEGNDLGGYDHLIDEIEALRASVATAPTATEEATP